VPSDKLQRVIDVNLNRSREALRVCEDIARFVFNDPGLSKALKDIRHKISRVAVGVVITSRNTASDIGRKRSFDKGRPKNIDMLFYKNMHRAQESVRCLEEFSKLLLEKSLPNDFKILRLKLYALEKKYDTVRAGKTK